MFARLALVPQRLLRVGVLLSLVAIPMAVGAAPEDPPMTTEADACQHYTHQHYHFPYAHYDTWEYRGHYTQNNNQHFHEYYNVQHNSYQYKDCTGAG